MAGVSRLELALLATFVLVTLVLVAFWRSGTLGGFVVLVAFGATLTWAVWLGWRPAFTRVSGVRRRGSEVGDESELLEAAA